MAWQAPERRRTANAVIDAATGASRSAAACTRPVTFACMRQHASWVSQWRQALRWSSQGLLC